MQGFKKPKRRHPVRALVFLAQPTVILVVILFVLVYWRVPTRVQVELVVDQKTFTVDMADTTAILRAINNQTIFIKEGTISYPGYPEIKTITFTFPGRIELEGLEDFQLEEIARNVEYREIRLRLDGIAKYIRTGSPESFQDRRLTRFDTLKNSLWVVILGIVAWLIATIIGWYRLYDELKG